jgi:hypothetical protein
LKRRESTRKSNRNLDDSVGADMELTSTAAAFASSPLIFANGKIGGGGGGGGLDWRKTPSPCCKATETARAATEPGRTAVVMVGVGTTTKKCATMVKFNPPGGVGCKKREKKKRLRQRRTSL